MSMNLPRRNIELIETLLVFDAVLVERLFFLGEHIIAFFEESLLIFSLYVVPLSCSEFQLK